MIVVYYDVEKGKHVTIDNVYSVLDDKDDGFVTVCFEDETREYSRDIPKEYLTSINVSYEKTAVRESLDNSVASCEKMNTRFSYMYRDAANYKDFYEFVFEGTLSDAQIQAFVDACNDEYFLPRAIGLPGGVFEGDDGYDSELDHYWCEHDFEDSFERVNVEPDVFTINGRKTFIKAEEFLELFTRCSEGWEAALTCPIDVFSIRAEQPDSSRKTLDVILAEAQEKQNTVSDAAERQESSRVVYSLCEEHEGDDGIREFRILGVASDMKILREIMESKIKEDEYGLIAENGVDEHGENSFCSKFNCGFVNYYITANTLLMDRDREKGVELELE